MALKDYELKEWSDALGGYIKTPLLERVQECVENDNYKSALMYLIEFLEYNLDENI
jgi:hypothetical protein